MDCKDIPITICADCRHIGYREGCLASPATKPDRVTGAVEYFSCRAINDGNCAKFQKSRTGTMIAIIIGFVVASLLATAILT